MVGVHFMGGNDPGAAFMTEANATLDDGNPRTGAFVTSGARGTTPSSSSSIVHSTLAHYSPVSSTAMNASCGICTLPTDFMRSLPLRCASSSLRLRVTSPP